ncbi:RDD family protein [Rhodococcus sp. WMMA185]|uniref:RDD family protein n=1 Tax=Rhodococcus sp. WMMA185 TaxID=679318 RepID=UPI000878B424|nr:RDD family protein [Rhodococcus sp. WMMA185]AOW93721.1 RDD family protein [Rhodococcus sp. WMMA185]
MTTGGFDPNQQQPPQYGKQQYGQAQPPFGGQPPQFDSAQQFYTRQFSAPDFGYNSSTPGELLPRIGARIIDTLIVGIPAGIVTVMLTLSLDSFLSGIVGGIVTAAAFLGYFVFLETTRGRTLGKQLLGLRVEGPDGGLPTQQQSLVRNSFYILSALGSLPIIGLLFGLAELVVLIVILVTIGTSPTKQGKHDEIAGGTRVVKG